MEEKMGFKGAIKIFILSLGLYFILYGPVLPSACWAQAEEGEEMLSPDTEELMLMDEEDIEAEPAEEIKGVEELAEEIVETLPVEEEKPKDIFEIVIPNSW
ncbi:MAG: hypothetical protein ABII75_09630, partial [Candidatus Omnitrophota bacterium]